jgi:hypothetical protein
VECSALRKTSHEASPGWTSFTVRCAFEKSLSGSHSCLPSPLQLECTGKNALNRVAAGYVKLRSSEAVIT